MNSACSESFERSTCNLITYSSKYESFIILLFASLIIFTFNCLASGQGESLIAYLKTTNIYAVHACFVLYLCNKHATKEIRMMMSVFVQEAWHTFLHVLILQGTTFLFLSYLDLNCLQPQQDLWREGVFTQPGGLGLGQVRDLGGVTAGWPIDPLWLCDNLWSRSSGQTRDHAEGQVNNS